MSGRPQLTDPPTASERQWLQIRGYLDDRRFQLGRAAATLYRDQPTIGPTPLLSARRLVPRAPIPLADVDLVLEPNRSISKSFRDLAAAEVLPIRSDGSRYGSYSGALMELAGRTFDNRSTYRIDAAHLIDAARMTFSLGRYFDGLDVGEACAHEFCAAELGLIRPTEQRIREAIGDPCDFTRRPANLAISTLTLRHDRASGETTCLLHWRDPTKVGHAGGLYQVLPVGIFQAAGEADWNVDNDFSLWRAMIREFAEEILGESEEHGADQAPINYQRWPIAAAMTQALDEGAIRAYVLGLGVDPLTFATDLLTVVLIDAEIYDQLFAGGPAANTEGLVISSLDEDHASRSGIPFTAETVSRFVRDEPMQAAGAALLWSAWEHRATLLG